MAGIYRRYTLVAGTQRRYTLVAGIPQTVMPSRKRSPENLSLVLVYLQPPSGSVTPDVRRRGRERERETTNAGTISQR